jgi:tetratricopeptide (TPR) repeat protein
MKPFDGLYAYEIVLLILGTVLFVAILIAFLRQVFTKQAYGGLLAFFVLPIIMIGFPAFQSFKIAGIEADLAARTQAVQQNPTNEQARAALQQDAEQLGSRPLADAQVNANLAAAQYALGNEDAAKLNLQKALQANPALPAAQDVKRKIELSDKLATLVPQVEAAPANEAAKQELSQTVAQLSTVRVANPNTLAHLAQAYATLGKQQEAQQHLDLAAKINPSAPAVKAAQIKVKALPVTMPANHQ